MMGWHYKSPQTFPAQFFVCIREAVKQPCEKVLLYSALKEEDARAYAENFRHFTWCVRKEPGAATEIYNFLVAYSFRTKIEDALGFHLWLTATPNTIAEFARLNPKLAESILPHCQ